jgi:hypothetical protein
MRIALSASPRVPSPRRPMCRQPQQWNAVLWGMVFGGVNLTMIARLLLERSEVTFSIDEMDLFHQQFEPFDVTPLQFAKLLESELPG